jgi:hypothetical protein
MLETGQEVKKSNIFVKHPHSIGETYLQHLTFASCCGFKMALAGVACIIHSLLPFIFITTASDTLQELTQKISDRKNKKAN